MVYIEVRRQVMTNAATPHPGAVAQPCCDGACCMHQTCHQVCNDDSSSAGSAGGGSWGRRLGGDDGADGDDATGYGGLAAYSYDIEADDNASLALLGGCYDSCHCDSWGVNTNSFSCDLCYAGVVETRFHTADTPEFYDVGWTRSDEELGDCYGETSRACADAFLNAHPRGAAGRCFYDPASRDARGHHVIAFVLDYTLWLWWLMALSCCCVCCCCAEAYCPEGRTPGVLVRKADKGMYRLVYGRRGGAGTTPAAHGEATPLVPPAALSREMPQPSAPPASPAYNSVQVN